MARIFLLLLVFQIKHFVADFLLQNKYMMGKFSKDWYFFLPLLAHAGINGIFTLAICLFINPSLWWLSLVDIVTHFFIDRIKAGYKYFGKFKALSESEMKENLEIMNVERMLGQTKYGNNIRKAIKHNTYFWFALGFDQMLHQVVYIFIVAALVWNL